MNKFYIKMKIMILTLVIFSALLGYPNGYYDSAENLVEESLRLALHNIIDGHNSQSYSSLHEHFESTDPKPNGTVWDMYSDIPGGTSPYVYYFTSNDQCGNYSGEGDCYNREHSWPSSWFNNGSPMKSDLFHVIPTDGYVNNRRSNYPFGEVGSLTWISENGSKLGSCDYPGYSGTVFEPIDEYKGDIARNYFYMSTRYFTEDNGWSNNGMVNGADILPWAITMLIEWHISDPVSNKEIDRNNAIYEIQNNRNPFIDRPEFVDRIWGSQVIEILGCTDPIALNYNPDATVDDGSCNYFEQSLITDITELNFELDINQSATQTFLLSNIGDEILSVEIIAEETLVDIEGNLYNSIQIGEQIWMRENLKVTHYQNGDEIETGFENLDWANLTTGAYSIYEEDENNANVYGNLYNWYVTNDNRNIAPEGWHIPTNSEWQMLINTIGGENIAGGKLKSLGLDLWETPNLNATNESGFTGLPAGYRSGSSGNFANINNYAYFWSSTEDTNSILKGMRSQLSYNSEIVSTSGSDKERGYSIRCIKNIDRDDWLTFSISTMNLQPDENVEINVQVSTTNLDSGSYLQNIRIVSNNIYQEILIPTHVTVNPESDVNDDLEITNYKLLNAYPNPFNPTTVIGFTVETYCNLSLHIYNVNGKLIETLTHGIIESGYHEVTWDASQYPTGIYFVKLISDQFTKTQKLMLVK